MDGDNHFDIVKNILWIADTVGGVRRFDQAVNSDAGTLVICTGGIRCGEAFCAVSLDYTLLIGECRPKDIHQSSPASVPNRRRRLICSLMTRSL